MLNSIENPKERRKLRRKLRTAIEKRIKEIDAKNEEIDDKNEEMDDSMNLYQYCKKYFYRDSVQTYTEQDDDLFDDF